MTNLKLKEERLKQCLPTLQLSTTIEKLYQLHLISKRTMKGCEANGIYSLGEILPLKEADMLKWKNCGKKVAYELSAILKNMSENEKPWTDKNAFTENIPRAVKTPSHILKSQFPFLQIDEIDFCNWYLESYSESPVLFIVFKYLIQSEKIEES